MTLIPDTVLPSRFGRASPEVYENSSPRLRGTMIIEREHPAEALSADFTRGKSFTDYAGDALLRSAVERQFETVGEALRMAL